MRGSLLLQSGLSTRESGKNAGRNARGAAQVHGPVVVGFLNLLWIFFILSSLQPLVQKQLLILSRRRVLTALAKERDATIITLIHRQETMSLFGFPLVRYIDIDDSQSVLRAIRSTEKGRAIEIVLHTPAGSCSPRARSRRRCATTTAGWSPSFRTTR
jgi:hypothetical protein